MANIYIYDGSFEGLITCIYVYYYSKIKGDEIYSFNNYNQNLIDNVINVVTDPLKTDKVTKALKEKVSPETLKNIFYVYLSNIPDKDTLILNYIKLAFKVGNNIDMHMHNDIVNRIHNIKRKVTFEAHRMTGFVRFSQMESGLLYSSIEPDHDILTLITPHFAERLSSENFIIHDIKRKTAALYNGSEWIITDFDKDLRQIIQDNFYEKLWKEYFTTLAIEDRTNARLQKRNMPSRYWKHLTEFKE